MTRRNPLEPATDPPTLTVTRYELLARDVVEALEAMLDAVPKLEAKERRSKAFIRTHIGIPQKFVATTAHAVESTPDLDRMNQMNVAAAYASRQLVSAFRPVVRRLADVVEEMQLLLDTRQANAAAEALKVYAIVRALVNRRTDMPLSNILKTMKRDLGRRGRRRKKSANAAVAPAPRKKRARPPRTPTQRLNRRLQHGT